MLQVLTTIFNTIIHSIGVAVSLISRIPTYINAFNNFVHLLPEYILFPLGICVFASVIISIKRLVIT